MKATRSVTVDVSLKFLSRYHRVHYCRTGLHRQRQKQREGKKEREVEERRMNKDYTAL